MNLFIGSLILIAGFGLGWLGAHLFLYERLKASSRTIRALEASLGSSERRKRILLERLRERESSISSLRLLVSHHERIIDDLKDRLQGQMEMIRSLRAAAYYRSGDLKSATDKDLHQTLAELHDASEVENLVTGEARDLLQNRPMPNGSHADSEAPEHFEIDPREEEK